MHKNSLYKTKTKGPEIRYIAHGNWRLVCTFLICEDVFVHNKLEFRPRCLYSLCSGRNRYVFFFHRRVFIIDAIVNEACRATNVLLSAAVGLYLIVFSNIIIDFFFSYKLWVLVLLTRSNFNLTWLEPDLNSSGALGT